MNIGRRSGGGIEAREGKTIGLWNGMHPYLCNCAISGRDGVGTWKPRLQPTYHCSLLYMFIYGVYSGFYIRSLLSFPLEIGSICPASE